MRLNWSRVLDLLIVTSYAIPVLAAVRPGLDHQRARHSAQPSTSNFPLLKRLRDYAVEVVFGEPLAKPRGSSPGSRQTLMAQYQNDVVLRFNLTTLEEEEELSDAAARLFLDIWTFTSDFVDIRIGKDRIHSLLGLLPPSLQASYSTLIPNLAEVVDATYPSYRTEDQSAQHGEGPVHLWLSSADDEYGFFSDYQPLRVIDQWMRLLEAMFPSITRVVSIGKSFEGRDIPALRVGVPWGNSSKNPRSALVITGGMHAREWISTTTVNYVAWSFITSYGRIPLVTKLLEKFDVIFIPVMNPDGFVFTWETDRLWRKSRQQTDMRLCFGLDLDHAFGYEWDGLRPQNDPCSESYGGHQPFEAVEALKLAQWARNETQNNVQFVGLIDLHSYSQQILYPFSYSCEANPPNLETLQEVAVGLSKAIRLTNGQPYGVSSACEGAVAADASMGFDRSPRIESGGGSAIDWFYHELQARYSYQIKLRDTGSYGFLLPRESIIPTGEEIFSAIKYLGDFMLGNNGIEKGGIVMDQADDMTTVSEL